MASLNEVKQKLSAQKSNYAQRYGVSRIGIFGSYSRGEQSQSSDIDIMVEFNKPIGLEFVNLANDLESLLSVKVDLVSRKSIKPRLFHIIEQDLIYV